jgi:hypothetical protein
VTAERTRYVVIRPAADLPRGYMPPDLDGRWFPRDGTLPRLGEAIAQLPTGTAYATGRYEQRDDGARAEVFEVRAL